MDRNTLYLSMYTRPRVHEKSQKTDTSIFFNFHDPDVSNSQIKLSTRLACESHTKSAPISNLITPNHIKAF